MCKRYNKYPPRNVTYGNPTSNSTSGIRKNKHTFNKQYIYIYISFEFDKIKINRKEERKTKLDFLGPFSKLLAYPYSTTTKLNRYP